MTFGKRLKEIRKDLGITQKEMSQRYGIGLSSLQRYENGQSVPGGIFLIDLATKGYNLHWLMTGDGDKLSWHTPGTDPLLRDIWEWLEEYQNTDEGYKDWFRIQFEKTFPEFREWKEKKG